MRIFKKISKALAGVAAALVMTLIPSEAFAQNVTVSGQVTDSQEEPLIGVIIDPAKTARGVYDHIGCATVFGGDGVAKLKSIKNDTMIANLATAMEKDGVALTRFFMMVEKEHPTGRLTEVELGRRLRELRLSDPSCVDESFAPILGWNAHGAIVHYEATEESDVAIEGDGLLLVDSGGQYTFGTTDITRTVALGVPTAEQRHDFTLVMKGHIASEW